MFGKLFYKMNPKVLAKIGEDFRKAGYLMGAGFVGMVISNDQISTLEGLVLFCGDCIFGLLGTSHYIILRKYLIQSKENQNESVLFRCCYWNSVIGNNFYCSSNLGKSRYFVYKIR